MQKELEKYKGKNISYDNFQNKIEESEEIEENEMEDISEDKNDKEENNNAKPNILNMNYNNQDKYSEDNIEEEEEEDNEMTMQEKMEKQDELYLKSLSKVTKDEIRKAKNIINQKELYESFVGICIAFQNLLLDINSLPSYKNFSEFLDLSPKETKESYQILKKNIQTTFFDVLLFHEEFLKKQSYPSSDQFNPVLELNKLIKNKENINSIKNLDKIHNNLLKIDQKIMNIWYRKTVVNQFQTNNKILKKLSNNNNFCEHILSSLENNMNTLLKKTQKYNNSDNNNQLLGRKRFSAEEYEYDKEIYNDTDFYNFLLKEFLLNNEKEIDENNYVEKRDENGLVEGRYDLTMKYILNRNTKTKKQVNNKTTKNRKIRYDKHEEIINFMIPETNTKEISGRNIMINSLFGTKKLNIDLNEDKKEVEKREAEKLEENDIDLI
jgi:protein AATF/BFR2